MENLKLIQRIAWNFHNSTGLEFDDLFQEASIAYLKAMKSYDSNKGAISTHCWASITNHLKNYLKEEKKWYDPLCDIETAKKESISNTPFWENLSNDAQGIAKLILESSQRFVYLTTEDACKRIKTMLIEQGWSEKKVNKGIYDLVKACN